VSSLALLNLQARLADVDQLMDAHSAITRFKKAERSAKQSGGELSKLADVFAALISNPKRGRPSEVGAINRAAFVLLTSHLQGFVDELHEETANIVLRGKAKDIPSVVSLVRPRNSNPHPYVIDQMFSGLGVYEVSKSIKWQKCKNERVRQRLREYIETRNKIAHGAQMEVTKSKVETFRKFVETFAEKLDSQVCKKAEQATGQLPW